MDENNEFAEHAKQAASTAAKKAKKAANKIKNKIAKAGGKKVVGAAVRKYVIIAMVVIFGIVFIGGLIVLLIQDAEYEKTESELYNSSSAESFDNTLKHLYYEEYAKNSYYYTVSRPEGDDDSYSGKTYEEILENQLGEEYAQEIINLKGLNQASDSKKIKDIDGFEDNFTLNYSTIEKLDQYLNGNGGNSTSVSYPKQFIQPVYTDCDLTDPEIDIKACSLKNLAEYDEEIGDEVVVAESTEYEVVNGLYKATDEKTNSVSDYGLGALLHYQGEYEPSRVINYHLEDMQIIDEDFKYGDTTEPVKTIQRSEITKDIIDEYSIDSETFIQPPDKNKATGYYDVSTEITYKDWIEVYDASLGGTDVAYFEENAEKWKNADPTIDTGIPETEIVYAIDKAITMYGDYDFNIGHQWTKVGTSTGVQHSYTYREFTEEKLYSDIPEEYKFNSDTTTTLRGVYITNSSGNGIEGLIGYIAEDPEVKAAEYPISYIAPCDPYGDDCDITPAQIESNEYVISCDGPTQTQLDGYRCERRDLNPSATASVTFKIVLTKDKENLSDVNKEYEIPLPYEYAGITNVNDLLNSNGELKEEIMEAIGYYFPFYIFSLEAHTEGDLEIYETFHTSMSSTNDDDDNFKYLKDYLTYYEAYVPTGDVTYYCSPSATELSVTETTGTGYDAKRHRRKRVETETTEAFEVSEAGECYDDYYFYTDTPNVTTISPALDLKNMSTAQGNKLVELLNYNTILSSYEGSFYSGSIHVGTEEFEDVDSEWSKDIEKYSRSYGVDPQLVKIVLYANDYKIIPGSYKGFNLAKRSDEIYELFDSKYDRVNIDESSSITDKVKATAIILENFLTDYNGNVPLVLAAYDASFSAQSVEEGQKFIEEMLEAYQSATGVSKNLAYEQTNNISWFHYVLVASKSTGIDVVVNGDYIGDHSIRYLTTGSSKNTILKKWLGKTTVTTISWSKVNIKDEVDVDRGMAAVETSYYNFINATEEDQETIWKLITYGREDLSTKMLIETDEEGNNTFKKKSSSDETIYTKLKTNISKSEIPNVLATCLIKQTKQKWEDLYQQIESGKTDFIFSDIGDLSITVEPLDVFDSDVILEDFASYYDEFKVDVDGTENAKFTAETKIKAPFDCDVVSAKGSTIVLEKNDTGGDKYNSIRIEISGVIPEVVEGEITVGTEIGTVKPDIKISFETIVYPYPEEDGDLPEGKIIPYSKLYKGYIDELTASLSNILYGSWKNTKAICGYNETGGEKWNTISSNASAIGFTVNGQCTTFSNARLYEMYGNINMANGNGQYTAENCVNNNSSLFKLQIGGTPKTGSIFSQQPTSGNSYGHTGFIEYVDEENDIIIVSDGNTGPESTWFSNNAAEHYIRENNVYRLSEWVANNSSTQYAIPINEQKPLSAAMDALNACPLAFEQNSTETTE